MDTPMKTRREELRAEMLEAEAQRSEIRRMFVVDGVETDLKIRVALDAKITRLASELHKYNWLEREEKQRIKTIHNKQLTAILIDKLVRGGLGKMVEEARAESLAQLEAAGLREAYES